mgnify:CR=1 FL=1
MDITQVQLINSVNRETKVALERAAQRLYDRASICQTYAVEQAFCEAAEIVRRTTDLDLVDDAYIYTGETGA